MNAIELTADIDDQHQLRAKVPSQVPVGPVRVIILLPDEEDAAGMVWSRGISEEWSPELRDSRQDIYTLDDGLPVIQRR